MNTMAFLHVCMGSLPGLRNGSVCVIVAVIIEVQDNRIRSWCSTWLRSALRSRLPLLTPS